MVCFDYKNQLDIMWSKLKKIINVILCKSNNNLQNITNSKSNEEVINQKRIDFINRMTNKNVIEVRDSILSLLNDNETLKDDLLVEDLTLILEYYREMQNHLWQKAYRSDTNLDE